MEDQVTRFKNKFLANRSNTRRVTMRKLQPEQSPDNWQQMFGTFLHDISLKKQHKREKTSNHLQDPLVHENPLLIPCTTQRFKLELFRYLEGESSVQEMMNSINFPTLKQEQTPDQNPLKIQIKKMRSQKNHHHSVPVYDQSTRTMQLKQQHLLIEGKFEEAKIIQQQLHDRTQKKVQVLREFIQERIELRKKANQEQRLEEIKNIHFIKTFYDISNEYRLKHQKQQEQLDEETHYFKKQVPQSKKLKQLYVNYENVQPYVKHQGKYFDKYSYPSIAILKDTMNQQSKEYLEEIQSQKKKRFDDALKQVRKLLESQNIRFSSNRNLNKSQPLDWQIDVTIASPKKNPGEEINVSQAGLDYKNIKDYVIAKKPFYLYTKRAKQDKNPKNAHGIITMFDLKLFDYIHNKNIYTSNPQLKQISDKFHTMIESKKEQEINTLFDTQLEQRKYQLNKMKRESAPLENLDNLSQYSDDQSLQSIYEVNLDMLYQQSHQLNKKLGEQIDGGFAKRIKQIIKLEEVNQQCLKTNLEKLTKQKIEL